MVENSTLYTYSQTFKTAYNALQINGSVHELYEDTTHCSGSY